MIKVLVTVCFALLTTGMPAQPPAAPSDDEVAARNAALTLAGAFSNDGFKIRDGHWVGAITPGESKLIQVNLYAGNQYWFSVGATSAAKKLLVTVFDESGKVVDSESYQGAATAAAGLEPGASGPYYVQVKEMEGDPSTFCMIYSYK